MDLDLTSKIQFQPKNWKYSKNRLSPLLTKHTVICRRHSKDINLSKQLSCELGSAEFLKVLNYRGCLYIVSQAELATLLGENPESNKSSKPSYQEHQSNMVDDPWWVKRLSTGTINLVKSTRILEQLPLGSLCHEYWKSWISRHKTKHDGRATFCSNRLAQCLTFFGIEQVLTIIVIRNIWRLCSG